MQEILQKIVQDHVLHAKWLNSLSFMENMGARKISASEDPISTSLIQLKHAAEEHRHAYYLKKQLQKLAVSGFEQYDDAALLAPRQSKQYLHRLDLLVCRYLQEVFGISGSTLKYAAYLFVTYAIELRADVLYPQYQAELTAVASKVIVKSIILEEEGHLEEMLVQLQAFHPEWERFAAQAIQFEEQLFQDWINAIENTIMHDKPFTNSASK